MEIQANLGIASDKEQILCKSARCLSVFSSSTVSRALLIFTKKCLAFLPECVRILAEFMQRTLAPLRRIVARDIEVLSYFQKSLKPQSFVIHDHLECGHEHASLSWDIFDLLNAYTTNPEVPAKRHRCVPCLELLAKPKPVTSVRVAAKGAVA